MPFDLGDLITVLGSPAMNDYVEDCFEPGSKRVRVAKLVKGWMIGVIWFFPLLVYLFWREVLIPGVEKDMLAVKVFIGMTSVIGAAWLFYMLMATMMVLMTRLTRRDPNEF